MNGSSGTEERLLEIVEAVYAAANDEEMAQAAFTGLRHLVPSSSGVFMPVAADTLELQAGFCFDCNRSDMDVYLAHYAAFDPYVLRQPSPTLMNQTIRFSDVATAVERDRGEFSEFMRRVPYYHALGILCAVPGQAVTVFSLHRQRHECDFSADEQAIVDRIGPHLARAMVLRRLAADPVLRVETGILAFGSDGQALYLNVEARRFLAAVPPEAVLKALPPQGTGVIRLTGQCYRVVRLPLAAASLLHRFALDAAVYAHDDGTADGSSTENWAAATQGRAVIVALRPFRVRADLDRRLAYFGLSPRQVQVASAVLRGFANKDIACQLGIREQTVKDHLADICSAIRVRTRTQLMAKLLGILSETPVREARER